jgi:hypothetical protein
MDHPTTINLVIELLMDLAEVPSDERDLCRKEINGSLDKARPSTPLTLGYDPFSAHGYMAHLPANQRKLMEACAASDDGFLPRSEALALLGRDPVRGSLKCITKPFERVLVARKASGRLPKHAVKPIEPVYDLTGPKRQRTLGLQLHVELIPLFRGL